MPICIGVTSARVRTLIVKGDILLENGTRLSCFLLTHCWTLLLAHQKYSETAHSKSHQSFGIKCLSYLFRSKPKFMSPWLSFSFRIEWVSVTQLPPAGQSLMKEAYRQQSSAEEKVAVIRSDTSLTGRKLKCHVRDLCSFFYQGSCFNQAPSREETTARLSSGNFRLYCLILNV